MIERGRRTREIKNSHKIICGMPKGKRTSKLSLGPCKGGTRLILDVFRH